MNNIDAFLTTIAISEGTQNIPGSDNGYRVIVGSTVAKPHLMDSYSDHPREHIRLSELLTSSAAGRYQILERIYDFYKQQLHLPDFSPASQDAIALQMIREQHAYDDIVAGRFDAAVAKCSGLWASLPGNTYRQHQNSLVALREAFTQAGGVLA